MQKVLVDSDCSLSTAKYSSVAMSEELFIVPRSQDEENLTLQHSKKSLGCSVSLAAISGFLFGYDTGIVSASLFYVSQPENFQMDTNQKEFFVTACIMAAIVGCIFVSFLDQHVGRKAIVLGSALLFSIGALTMALCPITQFWVIILGRSLVGLGIGASSTIVPVYIAELSPPRVRGKLTVANNAFCTGGQFCAALIAYGLSFLHPSISWRFMLGFGLVPAVVQLIGFAFMPESPRWLILKGHRENAKRALSRLKIVRGEHFEMMLEKEVAYIEKCLEIEQRKQGSPHGKCVTLFTNKSMVKALLIGCLLQFTQQVAGINTIMYYGSQIVEKAFLQNSSLPHNMTTGSVEYANGHTIVLVTAAFSFMNFVFTLVGICLADRTSRRCLTLSSLALVRFLCNSNNQNLMILLIDLYSRPSLCWL